MGSGSIIPRSPAPEPVDPDETEDEKVERYRITASRAQETKRHVKEILSEINHMREVTANWLPPDLLAGVVKELEHKQSAKENSLRRDEAALKRLREEVGHLIDFPLDKVPVEYTPGLRCQMRVTSQGKMWDGKIDHVTENNIHIELASGVPQVVPVYQAAERIVIVETPEDDEERDTSDAEKNIESYIIETKDLWTEIDHKNVFNISLEQFQQHMSIYNSFPNLALKRVFQRMDSSKTGRVSQKEWYSFINATRQKIKKSHDANRESQRSHTPHPEHDLHGFLDAIGCGDCKGVFAHRNLDGLKLMSIGSATELARESGIDHNPLTRSCA